MLWATCFSPFCTASHFCLAVSRNIDFLGRIGDVQCWKWGPVVFWITIRLCLREMLDIKIQFFSPCSDRWGWERYVHQLWTVESASAEKIPTILPGFENHHVIFGRGFQETRSGIGGKIGFGGNQTKPTASMATITTAVKCQKPVADGLSSKASQLLPPIVPTERDILDAEISETLVEVIEKSKTALSTLADGMKWDPCITYTTWTFGSWFSSMRGKQ